MNEYYMTTEEYHKYISEQYEEKAINKFAEMLIDKLNDEIRENSAAYIVQDRNHYFLGFSHGLTQAVKLIEEILNYKKEGKEDSEIEDILSSI